MSSETESDLLTLAYMQGVADEGSRGRAAVAELVEAGDKLVDNIMREIDLFYCDAEMNEAVERFRQALSRHQAGLGKGDDRG